MTVDPIEPTSDAEPDGADPRRRHAVTNQWAILRRDLRAGARMVRRAPGHAVEDPHAERVVAAGMGLLVLLGAIVTYVAVVGGIDPLLAQSPARGAPPAVVPRVTPTPTADPTMTPSAPGESPVSEPTPARPRSRPAAPPPETSTPDVPRPTPTPTPTAPSPTPTPSPFR